MLIYRPLPRQVPTWRTRKLYRTRRAHRIPGPRPMLEYRFLALQCAPGAIQLRVWRPKIRLTLIRSVSTRPKARRSVFRAGGPLRCVRERRWSDTFEFMAPRHAKHRRRYGLPLASVAAHRLPALGCVEVPF